MFVIHPVVLAMIPLTFLQGINRERASENGYYPRIHQQIITSLVIFTTGGLPNGFSKAVCLVNGSRLALFCGSMANVCSSISSPIYSGPRALIDVRISSRIGEDHSLVRHHPALYPSMSSDCLTVPRSYKTS